MFIRLAHLLLFGPDQTDNLVVQSYNRISTGYDQAWTNHMRGQSEELVRRLGIRPGEKVVDLTCGTGFVTNLIADHTGAKPIGVDRSEGMLAQARANYPGRCEFVRADVLRYLKTTASGTLDVVTCCWGLGYSKPFAVLREIKRVLKPGGKVGIIDNSIFSLAEVLYCSFLAFLECPAKLRNVMRFRFLTGRRQLEVYWRVLGMTPLDLWRGSKDYQVASGVEAIEKLRATGAAAGFEYAANAQDEKQVFDRFAEIIEQKYLHNNVIKITHRYLAGIARK